MNLAINQPTFFPWLGFFALLKSVDRFVFLDNVQVSIPSFVIRNRLLAPDGKPRWITAPLQRHPLATTIHKAKLSIFPWREALLRRIADYYQKAPNYTEQFDLIRSLIETPAETLAEYNIRTTVRMYKEIFEKELDYIIASELQPDGLEFETPQDRVLDIFDRIGSIDAYYNAASGIERGLYSIEVFRNRGVSLFKQSYKCVPYRQVSKAFYPSLSILDLMLNEAPEKWADIINAGGEWQRLG